MAVAKAKAKAVATPVEEPTEPTIYVSGDGETREATPEEASAYLEGLQ